MHEHIWGEVRDRLRGAVHHGVRAAVQLCAGAAAVCHRQWPGGHLFFILVQDGDADADDGVSEKMMMVMFFMDGRHGLGKNEDSEMSLVLFFISTDLGGFGCICEPALVYGWNPKQCMRG